MRVLLVVLALFCAYGPRHADASDLAWRALREPGAVALIRHSLAPGTGDPPGFRLGDCSTQRNLSKDGRERSRRIGAQFRANDIAIGRVLSSQWCRCLDTARLAFGDRVEPSAALNSFFEQDGANAQTRALRDIVQAPRPEAGVLVLVTHQVNITALTGIFPAEGEVLVLRPGGPSGFTVAARFVP